MFRVLIKKLSKMSALPLCLRLLLPLVTFILFSGCSQGVVDPFDRQTGATQKEIKDIFFGDKSNKNNKSTDSKIPKFSTIPQSSRMIAIPSFTKVNNEKLISFSVTEQVPLKDVLIELAKAAKLDVDLDPTISGGVIINAKNRPLTEVLDRICDMGSLRYTLSNNRLYVERDLPYAKNYALDFLIDGDLWSQVETNILALIKDTGAGAASSAGGAVSSNKLSNTMTIFASQKNHLRIVNYLEQVKKKSSAQVLIEAKVVEVTLKDTYRTGINWSWTGMGKAAVTQNSGGVNTDNPIAWVIPKTNLFGGGINATISALEEFGTVKAIASPRISALNNQKATLNFTKKLVYFTNDVSTSTATTTSGATNQNVVTSTMHQEATGTELTIIPAIDLASNEITLNVKPKIVISNDVAKQKIFLPSSTEVKESDLVNEIPIINTRELSTIAKIQSGSVLVIGGVMTEDTNNTDSGVPFLSRIPVLGNLFKAVSKVSKVTETVVFIKATIVGTGEGVSKYDSKIHDTFTSSNRPFIKSN